MALYDFATRNQNEQGAFYNMPTYGVLGLGHSNQRLKTNLKEGIYAYKERPTVRDATRRTAAIKGWRTRRRGPLSPLKGNGNGDKNRLRDFKYVDPYSTTMYIPHPETAPDTREERRYRCST